MIILENLFLVMIVVWATLSGLMFFVGYLLEVKIVELKNEIFVMKELMVKFNNRMFNDKVEL